MVIFFTVFQNCDIDLVEIFTNERRDITAYIIEGLLIRKQSTD